MLIFTSENFEKEVLQSDKPVLVDFFATWCGPCKAMHPVLEELDLEEDFKVGQVDIDEYPELVSKYHIMSVPFFIVFKNGEVAGKTIGVQSKEELLAAVRRPDSDSGRHRHRRPDRYYLDFEKEDTFPVSSFMQKVFSTISKIRIGSDNHLPASQTDFRILLR